MPIFAVTMVRDEVDVIGAVLLHLFSEGVDHVIVADNMSVDGTREVLNDLATALPISIEEDKEPGFFQDLKMSRLANLAREAGAEWVIPFDADEVWYSPHGRIGDVLSQAGGLDVLVAQGWDHIAKYDGVFSPWRRDHLQQLPKVAFRATKGAELHMGNHDVNNVGGRREWNVLEYRHFQYRSFEQMKQKVRQGKAAYDASTVHELHGTHWRTLGALSDDALQGEWEGLCSSSDLIHDPAPLRASLSLPSVARASPERV